MNWPRRPVEQIPSDQFKPPFCPNKDCPQHCLDPEDRFRHKRDGIYFRKRERCWVQRYRCKVCKKGFSQRTFAWSYYLKRPELGPKVAALLVSGCAHRQIARLLGCAPSTVTRLVPRIGRLSMLLLCRMLAELGRITEPVVLDHFETFVQSQLDALGLGTAVGHESWFVYALDPAPHRRGGKLTPAQKRQVKERKRPLAPPGGVSQSMDRLLDVLTDYLAPGDLLDLWSDDHPAYRSAVARHPHSSRIRHHVYPNPARGPKGSPRSPEAQERDAAMFPVDQYHSLLRHSCKDHGRETIAFSRRINSALERGFNAIIWRNLVKGRSERKPDRTTPAMRLGLTDRPWKWEWVFSQRLFLTRERVPECWKKVYWRDWDDDVDGAKGKYARHGLKHAV
jgi:transposase-like protein